MSHSVSNDNISISIGDNAQNVAAGKNIYQKMKEENTTEQITEADLIVVRELFAELKRQVEAKASEEAKRSAIERVQELEETVISKNPDLTTMEYIKKWFGRNLPQLTGSVISVLINPIVGKVVEAAGEIAVGELKRRFEPG